MADRALVSLPIMRARQRHEILRSWRAEHRELAVIPSIGPPKVPRSCAAQTGTCWPTCTGYGHRRARFPPRCLPWTTSPMPCFRSSQSHGRIRRWSATSCTSTANPQEHLDPREDKAMDLGFEGATAVVTGGSKGMGLAIAESLVAEGASVAIMARGQAALNSAVERLRNSGAPEVLPISVDMADAESIEGGYASVKAAWGQLNVLVHTVGPMPAPSTISTTRTGTARSTSAPCRRCVRCERPCPCSSCGLGAHRHAVRSLDSAPEPAIGRVHRRQVGPVELHQESLEEHLAPRESWSTACVPAPS